MKHEVQRKPGRVKCEKPLGSEHVRFNVAIAEMFVQLGQLVLKSFQYLT